MKHALAVLAILAMITPTIAAEAGEADNEQLDLRLRLAEGDTYIVTTTTKREREDWRNDVESIESSVTEVTQQLEVVDVDADGTIALKVTYTRYTVKAQNEETSFVFDSDTPPKSDDPLVAMNACIIGQSFTAKLSPAGDVLAIEDCQALHDAYMATVGVTARTSASLDVTNLVCVGTIKEHLERLLGARPDKPVPAGSSWTRKEKRQGEPDTACDCVYTLTSRAAGVASVNVLGDLAVDPGARQRADAIDKFQGTLEGTYAIDEASGMTAEAKLRTAISFELVRIWIREDDGEKTPEAIPSGIDTTITIKCTKQP